MDKVLNDEHRDEVLKPPLQLCSFITHFNVPTSLNPNKFMTGFENGSSYLDYPTLYLQRNNPHCHLNTADYLQHYALLRSWYIPCQKRNPKLETRNTETRNAETRNPETQKPRNPETQKPRNPETQKPRNPETQKPRNQRNQRNSETLGIKPPKSKEDVHISQQSPTLSPSLRKHPSRRSSPTSLIGSAAPLVVSQHLPLIPTPQPMHRQPLT